MAKFVIAGQANCASFARAEMLSERLSASLPHFTAHKVVVSASEWPNWLSAECSSRGWSHTTSPLVWRELVDRGGKGLYVGGLEEFQHYASHYYDTAPDTETSTEEKIAIENAKALELEQRLKRATVEAKPFTVAITNGASPLAYQLAYHVGIGLVCGERNRVQVNLLATSQDDLSSLKGVAMEMEDLASPQLSAISVSFLPEKAFVSADLVFVIDFPSDGDEPLETAALRYHTYCLALTAHATENARVIVAGKFANTGAAILAQGLPEKMNVIAAPSLLEQRAKAVVSRRLGLGSCSRSVSQVAIWGRTEGCVADLAHTHIAGFAGAVTGPAPFTLPLQRCVFEADWIEGEFPKLLSARGGSGQNRALAEAAVLGELAAEWSSEGVRVVEGGWRSVGVRGGAAPDDIVFSQPARLVGGAWEAVKGLPMNEALQKSVSEEVALLQTELSTARTLINASL